MYLKIVFSCTLLVLVLRANCEDLYKHKVDSLYHIAWGYLEVSPDSSIYFADLQKQLAISIGYDLGLVNAYYVIGYAYDEKFIFDMAAANYFKGLDVARKHSGKEFKRKQLYLLQCLGIVYEKTYGYDNSIKYMNDALQVAEEIQNKESMGELYYNLAVNYRKKGEYPLAIENHFKSIEISKSISNFYMQAKAFNSLGVIYNEIQNYDLANDNLKKALQIGDTISWLKKDIAMFTSNLGEVYFLQDDLEKAKFFYEKALSIASNNKDTARIKWIYNNLGDVSLAENKFKEAINYFENAIALGNTEVLDEELQRAYKNIALAYEAIGEYKMASDYKSGYISQTDKIVAIKEDLSQQNAQYRMKEIDWQRQLMQREVLLAGVEKENFWGRVIIGVALLLILISARLIYVYYRKISMARKVVNSYRVDMFDF